MSDDFQDRITRFWSAVAGGYDSLAGNVPPPGGPEAVAWVKTLAALLPPAPADVLDVATGTGFVAAIAAGLGHRVTAIDLAEPMLAEARARAERDGVAVDFRLGDAVAPDFPPACFDVVINRLFLWTLRDLEGALASWRRLLRPGGRLVGIDAFRRMEPPPSAGFFEDHYPEAARLILPGWRYTDARPCVDLAERQGFMNIQLARLDDVRADAAPSDDPPLYALTAYV